MLTTRKRRPVLHTLQCTRVLRWSLVVTEYPTPGSNANLTTAINVQEP